MTRRNLFKSLLGLCGIGFVAESNHSKYTWSSEKFWMPPLTADQLKFFKNGHKIYRVLDGAWDKAGKVGTDPGIVNQASVTLVGVPHG